MQEHSFLSASAMASAQASTVAKQLQAALKTRGQAQLAVSGGRSPIAFFQALRQAVLDWSKVTVLLVDERCVSETHPDSNALLVRTQLLQGAASAARFVSYTEGQASPEALSADAWLAAAQAQIERVLMPLDVVVLGMGDDGHTASWFPGVEGLTQALSHTGTLAWVRPPAYAPHLRITLTQGAVLSARHIHLALAGTAKLQVYEKARVHETPEFPVSFVLAKSAQLDVWLTQETP